MHGPENLELFLEFLDPAEENNELCRRFYNKQMVLRSDKISP